MFRRGRGESMPLMLTLQQRRGAPVSQRRIALLAAAVFAVLVALLIAPGDRARAVVPGANGQIAFTTDRDGNNEIYVMKPNGSGQARVTKNAADDSRPSWSPNGKK